MKKLTIALIIIAVIVAAVVVFMLVGKQKTEQNQTPNITDASLASIYSDIESITNEPTGLGTNGTDEAMTPLTADDLGLS